MKDIKNLTENIEKLIIITKELTDHALRMNLTTNYYKQFDYAEVSEIRELAEKELRDIRGDWDEKRWL